MCKHPQNTRLFVIGNFKVASEFQQPSPNIQPLECQCLPPPLELRPQLHISCIA